MTGHACPECGRQTAGEPGTGHRVPCRCGAGAPSARLTEDEQRAARTAEIAAAEDFDPLRIRPYVTLTDHAGVAEDGGGAGGLGPGPPVRGRARLPACGRVRLPACGRVRLPGPARRSPTPQEPRELREPRSIQGRRRARCRCSWGATAQAWAWAAPAVRRIPRRTEAGGAPRLRAPSSTPTPCGRAAGAVRGARRGGGRGRRGRHGGFRRRAVRRRRQHGRGAAGGHYERPGHRGRTSRVGGPVPVPVGHSVPYTAPIGHTVHIAVRVRLADEEPRALADLHHVRVADGECLARPGRRPPPAAPSAAPPAGLTGGSLRPGDRGPEVAELQHRLKEVWLYVGPPDGNYDDQVRSAVAVYQSYKAIQGDPTGVYGPNTRRALEAETN